MQSSRIPRQELIDRVAERGGFVESREARRAILATLATLGERLDELELGVLARALPRPFATALRAGDNPGEFDIDELYARVHAREGVSLGFAREHAQTVCRALGDMLPAEARLIVLHHLPPEFGLLFEPQPTSEPPPHRVGPSARHHTLATGKPGSLHPVSESAPHDAHEHSVAREPNPHGETKVSSSRGLTQERLEESMANAIPDPSRRISRSSD